MVETVRGPMRAPIAALAVLLLLSGCRSAAPVGDAPERSEAEPARQGLVAALERTRAAGAVAVEFDLPEGVWPTLTVTGVIDFERDRSVARLRITPDPGAASLSYGGYVFDDEHVYLATVPDPKGAATDVWRRAPRHDEPQPWDALQRFTELEDRAPDWREVASGTGGVRYEPVQSESPPQIGFQPTAAVVGANGLLAAIEYRIIGSLSDKPAVLRLHDHGQAPPVELPEVAG